MSIALSLASKSELQAYPDKKLNEILEERSKIARDSAASSDEKLKRVLAYIEITRTAADEAKRVTDMFRVFDRNQWVQFLRDNGIEKKEEILFHRWRWKRALKDYDDKFKSQIEKLRTAGVSETTLWAMNYRFLEDSYREGPRGRFIGRRSCLYWLREISTTNVSAEMLMR